MGRVEQAKQVRSIYWHIPLKENTTQPRTYNISNTNGTQEVRIPGTTLPAQTTTQRLKEAIEPTILDASTLMDAGSQALPSSNRSTDQLTDQSIPQTAPEAETTI